MKSLGFDRKNFIAEIGVNHENDIGKAFQMIRECADLGVGAVKFQSYKSHKLAAPYSPSYWDTSEEVTTSQAELFSKYDQFGKAEYERIAKYCVELGIEFMTTPFDVDYVEELAPLLKRYKVASVDITNFLLLEAIAAQKKPIILSTGASTINEVGDAVRFLRDNGADDISLLHCVINYPTAIEDAGLGNIGVLKSQFPELTVGYSDHTRPNDSATVLPLAVALGASIIEKHYTFDKSLPGNDHYHSFDVNDLERFLEKIDSCNKAFAAADLDGQSDALSYARRGLYFTTDLPAGTKIQSSHLQALRPKLDFVCPSMFEQVVGKKLARAVTANTGVTSSLVK